MARVKSQIFFLRPIDSPLDGFFKFITWWIFYMMLIFTSLGVVALIFGIAQRPDDWQLFTFITSMAGLSVFFELYGAKSA